MDEIRLTLVGGRYELLRELGSGGSATVYLAREVASELGAERLVAVKVLRDDVGFQDARMRFSEEIRVMGTLQHPNIVTLISSGVWNDRPYLVMPFVEGESLAVRLRREGRLPLDDVLRIGVELCDALEYSHRHGIVHRDVKPSNVLITSSGHAMLADFGVARWMELTGDDRPTRSSAGAPGTITYSSPEQLAGERHLDGRSDIFSLGCVLFEALAGEAPFRDSNPRDFLVKRLTVQAPSLLTLRSDIPAAVDAAIGRALAVDAHDRWDSPKAFGAHLAHAMTSASSPSKSWTGPRTRFAILGACIAAVVLAGWFSQRGSEGRSTVAACAADTDDDVLRLTPLRVRPGDAASTNELAGVVKGALEHGLSKWTGGIAILGEPGGPSDDVVAPNCPGAMAPASIEAFAWQLARDSFGVEVRLTGGEYGPNEVRRVRAFEIRGREELTRTTERLADSLVLPRWLPENAHYVVGLTRNLAVLRAYSRALQAVASGRLGEAAVDLDVVVSREPSFLPAKSWLTQLIAWGAPAPTAAWLTNANMHLRGGARLSRRDSLFSRAALGFATSRFREACHAYDALLEHDAGDYLAWFGRGECERLDSTLVRRGAGELSFQGSYSRALDSYRQSMLNCPPAFGALIVDRVQMVAPSTTRFRPGWFPADGPTSGYAALPAIVDGRLTHTPVRLADVFAGRQGSVPQTLGRALAMGREQLLEFSGLWLQRAPREAGAYMAHARGLELRGVFSQRESPVRSALSMLDTAQRLVSSDSTVLRLEEARVRIFVKMLRTREARIAAERAVRRAYRVTDAKSLRILAGLAALIGSSERSSYFLALAMRSEREADGVQGASAGTIQPYADLMVLSALGICGDTVSRLIGSVSESIDREVEVERRAGVRQVLLDRPLSLSAHCDAYRPAERTSDSSDALVRVQRALARSDSAAVRAMLLQSAHARSGVGRGEVSLDYAVAETEILTALGDADSARANARNAFRSLAASASFTLSEVPLAAAVGRGLRSLDADSIGPPSGATGRRLLGDLWAGADAIVRGTLAIKDSHTQRSR